MCSKSSQLFDYNKAMVAGAYHKNLVAAGGSRMKYGMRGLWNIIKSGAIQEEFCSLARMEYC